MQSILMLSTNLMSCSQIQTAVGELGFQFSTVSSVNALHESCKENTPFAIVLDLNIPNIDFSSFQIPEYENVHKLAFGPHVYEELLAEAGAANFQVLTQGEFYRTGPQVLQSLTQ